MKLNFCLYSYVFVLFFNLVLPGIPSFALTNNKKTDFKEISTDFLNKVQSNSYILGPGDTLRINVSRDLPELMSMVQIDGEGTIYLPRLKKVYVNELTVNELTLLLRKAYQKYIKNPDIEIVVINYRPIRVLVEGEVTNPGVRVLEGAVTTTQINSLNSNNYLLQNKTKSQAAQMILNSQKASIAAEKNYNPVNYFFPTVFDAIRQSGGITEYSNLSNIEVIRKDSISNGKGKISTTLDFSQVLTFGNDSQNIRIYDSDIIRVRKLKKSNELQLNQGILSNLNPRLIRVFVAGRVLNPGLTTVSRTSVLTDAVMLAGGTKVLKGPLVFVRTESDGTIDKRKFGYKSGAKRGSYKNPKLKDGDVILVGNSFLSITNDVLKEFTSPFFGIYAFYGLLKDIKNE